MYTVYRVLSYIINSLLLLSILIQFLVILFGNKELFEIEDIIVGIILFYSVLTSTYFLIRTKKIYTINLVEQSELIDADFISKKVMRFQFDKVLGVSNIILAGLLIVYSVYILIFDPITEFRGEELARFLVVLFAIAYGFMQILYSLKIIKIVNNSSSSIN